MFLSVKHIARDGVRVERRVRPRAVTDAEGRVIPFEPVSLEGLLTPRKGGFSFRGRLWSHGTFECARCLEPFRLRVESEFDLFYSASAPQPAEEDEPDLEFEVESFSPLEDEKIDLATLVSEQIYLNLPLKPLCGPECRGLCARCGANRNLSECRCESGTEDFSPDSPFASMRIPGSR